MTTRSWTPTACSTVNQYATWQSATPSPKAWAMLTAAAPNSLRGWADRVAEGLGAVDPQAQYVNLAIRGRLLIPIPEEQLPHALELKPQPRHLLRRWQRHHATQRGY